jgi:hypothetical protein
MVCKAAATCTAITCFQNESRRPDAFRVCGLPQIFNGILVTTTTASGHASKLTRANKAAINQLL